LGGWCKKDVLYVINNKQYPREDLTTNNTLREDLTTNNTLREDFTKKITQETPISY
jgi:hypothetical protein